MRSFLPGVQYHTKGWWYVCKQNTGSRACTRTCDMWGHVPDCQWCRVRLRRQTAASHRAEYKQCWRVAGGKKKKKTLAVARMQAVFREKQSSQRCTLSCQTVGAALVCKERSLHTRRCARISRFVCTTCLHSSNYTLKINTCVHWQITKKKNWRTTLSKLWESKRNNYKQCDQWENDRKVRQYHKWISSIW